jgi:hypothetical protein
VPVVPVHELLVKHDDGKKTVPKSRKTLLRDERTYLSDKALMAFTIRAFKVG